MAGTLGRNLHLCFTKNKRPREPQSPSSLLASQDHNHPLVTNFNSLFDYTFDSATKSPVPSSSEPDFATVFASHRFFFSSPGHSNSIIESTPSIATSTESSGSLLGLKCNNSALLLETTTMNNDQSDRSSFPETWNSATVKDSVAVPTYSPDPYLDFRRSMQEMVEARDLVDVKANWDYLHELLLCYLALNAKSTHKFIIRAFADLLVSLLASQPSVAAKEE